MDLFRCYNFFFIREFKTEVFMLLQHFFFTQGIGLVFNVFNLTSAMYVTIINLYIADDVVRL
jgi:hypothetical protein